MPMPKATSPITQSLQKRKNRKPLWQGPCDNGPMGGITQSMLSSYVGCAERFRIKTVEGLQPQPMFRHAIEYGNMWHVCEESLANNPTRGYHSGSPWVEALQKHCRALCKKYLNQQEEIDKWYNCCKMQFPIYVDYWKKHPDVKDRKPLTAEKIMHTHYQLPSGRVVWLRAKLDSVDLVTKGSNKGVWLQENKSKSEIDKVKLQRQLTFDLQTMFYLVMLNTILEVPPGYDADQDWRVGLWKSREPVRGVRYNVIKRPLSGGKGSIKQLGPSKKNPQGETKEEYYDRLQQYFIEEPDKWFMRWNTVITQHDIDHFKQQFLHPVLENVCDDYEWWADRMDNHDTAGDVWNYGLRETRFAQHKHRHYRLPFGIYNVIAEGGSSDLDEYLATGNETGLTRDGTLFEELQQEAA